MQEERSFSRVSQMGSPCALRVWLLSYYRKQSPPHPCPLLFVKSKAEGNCCLPVGPQDGALTLCLKHVGARRPPLPLDRLQICKLPPAGKRNRTESMRWSCRMVYYHFSLLFKQSKNERSISAVSSLSLLADGKPAFSAGVSAPHDPSGRSPASLHPAFLMLNLLIHFFLPFVKYGEKGRMNGQSLTGGAGSSLEGPSWR